jgi:hypothetical protein
MLRAMVGSIFQPIIIYSVLHLADGTFRHRATSKTRPDVCSVAQINREKFFKLDLVPFDICIHASLICNYKKLFVFLCPRRINRSVFLSFKYAL